MQVEQEQSRQTWLRAFGLTPWVATTRFPGAAHLTLQTLANSDTASQAEKHRPEQHQVTETAEHPGKIQHTPIAASADTGSQTPREPEAAPLVANRESSATTKTLPNPVLCLVADTLLIAEQQDRAPELTPNEQRLLHALMQLFGSGQPRFFPFPCPLAANEAQEALAAFTGALAQQGCKRLLLCLSSAALTHLLGQVPTYEAFQFAGLPALCISPLGSMLSAPSEHKRRSWQAMQNAGFSPLTG